MVNQPSANVSDSTPLMDGQQQQQGEGDGPVEPVPPPPPASSSSPTAIPLENPFAQSCCEGVAPSVSGKKLLQPQQQQQQQRCRPAVVNNKTGAKRRVSRVESLRNLFLRSSKPSSSMMARAESIAAGQQQQQQHPPTSQQEPSTPHPMMLVLADAPDVIQEAQKKTILIRESSISTISGGSSSSNRLMPLPNRSISLENVSASSGVMGDIQPDVAGTVSKKSHFPYSFIRSRLHRPLLSSSCEAEVETASTTGSSKSHNHLPASNPVVSCSKSGSELNANTTASCDDLIKESARQSSHPDLQLASIRYRSVVSVRQNQQEETFKLVRRKRSFSLAALPLSAAEATQTSSANSHRSEESGYESDATRNGYESPRRASADSGKPDPASSIHVSFVSSLKSVEQEPELAGHSRPARPTPTPTKNRPMDHLQADKFSLDGDFDVLDGRVSQQQQHRCCNCRCNNNSQQPDGMQQLNSSRKEPTVMFGVAQLRTLETAGSRSPRHLPVISDSAQAGRYARSSSLDRKKWLQPSVLVEIGGASHFNDALNHISLPPGYGAQHVTQHPPRPSSSFAYAPQYQTQQQQPPQAQPQQPQRQFKMLRLVKGETGELGIYIKKKPSPDSGSVGYVIAGIEPGALAHR